MLRDGWMEGWQGRLLSLKPVYVQREREWVLSIHMCIRKCNKIFQCFNIDICTKSKSQHICVQSLEEKCSGQLRHDLWTLTIHGSWPELDCSVSFPPWVSSEPPWEWERQQDGKPWLLLDDMRNLVQSVSREGTARGSGKVWSEQPCHISGSL